MLNANEFCTYLHVEAAVVVGQAHVPIIEQPHISHVEYFVVSSFEEGLEVFARLYQVTEPDQGWQVGLAPLEVRTTQDYASSILMERCLCRTS